MPKLLLLLFIFASAFNGVLAQDDEMKELMQQMEKEREQQELILEKAQKALDSQNSAQHSDSQEVTSSGGAGLVNIDIDQITSNYRAHSPEQTKEHLRSKLKGKPIVDNPKMVNFIDALIRDSKALKDIMKIIENKKKLVAFFVFNILILIIGYVFKKMHAAKNQNSGIGMRFIRGIWRFVFMTGIRLGIFIYFFGSNFARTWSIAKEHLF